MFYNLTQGIRRGIKTWPRVVSWEIELNFLSPLLTCMSFSWKEQGHERANTTRDMFYDIQQQQNRSLKTEGKVLMMIETTRTRGGDDKHRDRTQDKRDWNKESKLLKKLVMRPFSLEVVLFAWIPPPPHSLRHQVYFRLLWLILIFHSKSFRSVFFTCLWSSITLLFQCFSLNMFPILLQVVVLNQANDILSQKP